MPTFTRPTEVFTFAGDGVRTLPVGGAALPPADFADFRPGGDVLLAATIFFFVGFFWEYSLAAAPQQLSGDTSVLINS